MSERDRRRQEIEDSTKPLIYAGKGLAGAGVVVAVGSSALVGISAATQENPRTKAIRVSLGLIGTTAGSTLTAAGMEIADLASKARATAIKNLDSRTQRPTLTRRDIDDKRR